MSRTHVRSALASYRDQVTELITEGATLGDVEVAINAQAGLTEDQKAALWLFAFSLHDRAEQQNDAQAHLTAVEVVAGHSEMTEPVREPDRAGPREFDANGFPVPQRNRSFLERVSRLRNLQ
jgi:hypothetical protein